MGPCSKLNFGSFITLSPLASILGLEKSVAQREGKATAYWEENIGKIAAYQIL